MRVLLALSLIISVSWSPETDLAPGVSQDSAVADTLTVLSLNLALRTDVDRIVSEIRAIGAHQADVLLFQEVVEKTGEPSVAHAIAAALGEDVNVVFGPGFALDERRTSGLATLSRVPIVDARVLPLKRFNLRFRSRDRTALATTVETPSGPLRLYNLHLVTRINGGGRFDQVADVIQDIHTAPGRALLAGDFNTNDHLWVFSILPLPYVGRQATALERYMHRHGFVSAFQGGATHDTLRMRLDWMFLKGMQATRRAIHPMAISDHHALVASIAPSN